MPRYRSGTGLEHSYRGPGICCGQSSVILEILQYSDGARYVSAAASTLARHCRHARDLLASGQVCVCCLTLDHVRQSLALC